MSTAMPLLDRVRAHLWLVPPLAVGAVLRLWGVLHQVAGGDELHAVRAALSMSLTRALVTYRPSDNCLPLTAFYRFLMDLGVSVSELHLRLPILVSGLLVITVAPLWVARRIGRPPAQALAWLLAISPVLVYYSRLIRSYMPVVMLGLGAAIAFEHWLRTHDHRSGALYVVFGVLAVYFHLGAAPFVASGFLFYLGAKVLARSMDLPSWRMAITLGVATLLGLLLFLVPAAPSLLALIAVKQEPLQVGMHTWLATAALQSGTGVAILKSAFWLLALVGLAALFRRQPALAGYSVVLVVGQVVGLLILSPKAMEQGPIFSRYLLVTLPFVLTWVAVGVTLVAGWRPERLGRALSCLATALLVGGLFLAGPLIRGEFWQSPFAIQPVWLHFYFARGQPDFPAPSVYSALDPGNAGAVVEYPWHTTWRYSRTLVSYQRIHGRDVIVAPAERLMWDERLAMRNMVAPRPETVLATRAAYLVLHLAPDMEEADCRGSGPRPVRPGSASARDREIRCRELANLALQASQRVAVFERRWGPPDLEGDAVRVWDLNRIRAR